MFQIATLAFLTICQGSSCANQVPTPIQPKLIPNDIPFITIQPILLIAFCDGNVAQHVNFVLKPYQDRVSWEGELFMDFVSCSASDYPRISAVLRNDVYLRRFRKIVYGNADLTLSQRENLPRAKDSPLNSWLRQIIGKGTADGNDSAVEISKVSKGKLPRSSTDDGSYFAVTLRHSVPYIRQAHADPCQLFFVDKDGQVTAFGNREFIIGASG